MTYSIVARDPDTAEMGVAVQSHYFQVGPTVPWAMSGVGAVATQSMVNVSFGPLGLELMRYGYPARQALDAVLAGDPERDARQCAIVDAQGRVAVHTGRSCIAEAGHRTGDGYSVQANLMERATVWGAMAEAYESTGGPLADRLMAALEAAEAEGGDIRGKQSAALLVVAGRSSGRPWEDRLFDIRVEDHPEPLPELRRLLRLRHAHIAARAGDAALAEGDIATARSLREEALRIAPEVIQLRFFAGVAIARTGDWEAAMPLLGEVIDQDPRWLETLRRMAVAGRVSREVADGVESRLRTAPR